MLDVINELRAAGAEAIEINAGDQAVRVGVDTWVVGNAGALAIDGLTLSPPYSVLAIGDPPTLAAAMNIPGGAVDSVERVGGTMTVQPVRPRRHHHLAATETAPIRSARQMSMIQHGARSTVSEVPPDLHYTAEHEWVRRTGDDTVRVGITDFAQSALGDVVFVQLARRRRRGDRRARRSARSSRPSRCPTCTRR